MRKRLFLSAAILRTPLCPAGHLPRKEGDQSRHRFRQPPKSQGEAPSLKLPISPLAGEMSGRTEGGAKDR
ncbi:hypothetical protein FJW07_16100, partial [Mesorhizobium sp. B3-1-9]